MRHMSGFIVMDAFLTMQMHYIFPLDFDNYCRQNIIKLWYIYSKIRISDHAITNNDVEFILKIWFNDYI